MLVLSRKVGEKICIGNSVMLTVLAVEGGKVRLGVEAPEEIKVFREEVLPRLGTAGRSSASPGQGQA